MFLSVLHFYNVLIFLDLAFAILCCILIVKLPRRYALKFAAIPLICFITYVMLIQGEDVLGRAYGVPPKGKFEFIEYRVNVEDGVRSIEIWVLQDKKSKLHIVDYTPQLESQLADARQNRKNGGRSVGQFSKGVESYKLRINAIPVENLLPPKELQAAPAQQEIRPPATQF